MEVKCDLVLLSFNNLDILKRCVESILRYTHTPSRLIIVDNGSKEKGVKEYLSSLNGNETIEIKIILNATNEGFAGGMNKGIKFSNSPYVCILNNDLLVTDGWLEEMIKVAESDPKIGAINPSSNNFGLRFGKGTTLNEFAGTFKTDSGRWVEMGGCIGFCMLIKREVICRIGHLDEAYGYAYFEDTDFSRRAQAAGYKCVMAKGCYVYHAEGKSGRFLKNKDESFKRSAEIFNKKWGRQLRVVFIVSGKDETLFEKMRNNVQSELKAHNRVWIFKKEGANIGGLPEHLDLMLSTFSKKFFNLIIFWNIIKKKKRFDRVYFDDRILRGPLELYRLLRGPEIMEL